MHSGGFVAQTLLTPAAQVNTTSGRCTRSPQDHSRAEHMASHHFQHVYRSWKLTLRVQAHVLVAGAGRKKAQRSSLVSVL